MKRCGKIFFFESIFEEKEWKLVRLGEKSEKKQVFLQSRLEKLKKSDILSNIPNGNGWYKESGSLAQSVEQWTENPCVPGSIPGAATIFFTLMPYEVQIGVTIMLGMLIFIIVVAGIYSSLEAEQKKQGGKPLTRSPIIRFGCGFVIFLLIICIIAAYANQ